MKSSVTVRSASAVGRAWVGCQKRRRGVGRRRAAATLAAAIGVTFAGGEAARANTPDYFTGLDTANPFALDDPANYTTLAVPPVMAVPTAANDAVIAVPTDAAVVAGATLTFNSSTSATQALGSLDVNTSSAITIYNQVPSTTVTLTLGGSTGNAYAPNAADLLFVASGTTLSINSSSTSTVYGSLPIALAQSGNFDVAGTAYVGSAISGAFGITKTGTGTLTLGASQSFTGGLTISAGTVSVASSTYLGAATSVTTLAGGTDLSFTNAALITSASTKTFVLSGGTAEIDAAVSTTLDGVISGAGGLVKGGPGVLNLTPTAGASLTSNTYAGGTTVAAGTLAFGTQNALPAGGTVTLDAGTVLLDTNNASNGTFMTGVNLALAGAATFNESTAARTFTMGGTVTGTGPLTKAGPGTLYLTNAGNTYSGGTNLSTGVLRSQVTLGTGTGTVTINAGLLGGNGSVGAVIVNTGGAIGAGPSGSVTGTLTTGGETWNTGGALLSKVGAAGTTSDTVVMSSLAFNASAFTVNLSNASTAAVVTSGTVLVLADDTDPTKANPFNASGTAPIALSSLALNLSSGVTLSDTTFALATRPDTLGNGGFDLVLEDVAATPEPTSLLLLGVAATPLAVGRRRSARGTRASG